MSDTREELQSKIDKLKEEIEQRKRDTQTASGSVEPKAVADPGSKVAKFSYSYPVQNTRFRGSRGRGRYSVPRHRNLTLVLAQGTPSDPENGLSDPSEHEGEIPVGAGDRFVSKVTKRGLSLVNEKVYAKEEERLQAIATRKAEAKLALKAERHRMAVLKAISANRLMYGDVNRRIINGHQFVQVKNTTRLLLVSDPIPNFPHQIAIDGLKYQTSRGVEYKLVVEPNGVEPCVSFSLRSGEPEFLTATTSTRTREYCKHYSRAGKYLEFKSSDSATFTNRTSPRFLLGICRNGETCRFIHDPERIALCKDFVRGSCFKADCLLQHKPTQYNSPSCKFFNIAGGCTNENCLYTHKVETNDVVCRPFAVGGYCEAGRDCEFRHSWDCPDFIDYGSCPMLPACRLNHVRPKVFSHNIVRNEDNDGVSPINQDSVFSWRTSDDGSLVISGSDSDDADSEIGALNPEEEMDHKADFLEFQ
ncbi:unnamed protein product [Kuraishia capsulata CBS 1993]|uniref:C3H1-type domain-containing protein n=1 Tax=Kuraishia capsulata CBS 1993 TaxID=1382522 RepID=W6MWL3_9ASCO|nr:uncharacterized protein KUCA_T00003589001 [Kuraishia capsulata CBS 1993]CDK27610.1 unnamed protein product [Kuraishia capsulata CBS 1993]